jgi:hypothetical protein
MTNELTPKHVLDLTYTFPSVEISSRKSVVRHPKVTSK